MFVQQICQWHTSMQILIVIFPLSVNVFILKKLLCNYMILYHFCIHSVQNSTFLLVSSLQKALFKAASVKCSLLGIAFIVVVVLSPIFPNSQNQNSQMVPHPFIFFDKHCASLCKYHASLNKSLQVFNFQSIAICSALEVYL